MIFVAWMVVVVIFYRMLLTLHIVCFRCVVWWMINWICRSAWGVNYICVKSMSNHIRIDYEKQYEQHIVFGMFMFWYVYVLFWYVYVLVCLCDTFPPDIDECQRGVCSQGCVNSIGSYNCSCFTGYSLSSDQTTCTGI